MQVAGSNGDNAAPGVDRALPTATNPHGNGGPIGPEAHRMPVTTSQSDNLTPLAHVARPLMEPTRSQHGAVNRQRQGPAPARGDKGHVAP